jgi:hypothetical protein
LGDTRGADVEREAAAQLAERGADAFHVTAAQPQLRSVWADMVRGRYRLVCGVGQ